VASYFHSSNTILVYKSQQWWRESTTL
jgi:hypothetical protein